MDIKGIAWGIAVNRIALPSKGGDPVVREIALKRYVDDLYAEQEKIIANFTDVLNELGHFVLMPKECSDEMAEIIATTANVCGGIAGDIYDVIIKQAVVEAAEGEN